MDFILSHQPKTSFAIPRVSLKLTAMHVLNAMHAPRTRLALLAVALTAGLGGFGPADAQARLDPPAPRPEGVTAAVERTIEKGFRYLIQNQEPDGSWGATPGQAGIYPVAVTGLVGLAFLAHGDTPTRGEHADVVNRATDYLLSTSTSSGLFTTGFESEPRGRKGPRPMYGHAFAMTFLGLAYGQEGDLSRRDRIREALRKGVQLTQRSQSNDGGWAYRANYFEDEGTLTVTQLQALRTCRDAGIVVPKSVIDRGVQFIVNSSNEDGSVRYRVQDQDYRPGVTCAAVVALWNAGQYDSPRLKKTQDWVNRYISHQWDDSRQAEHAEYIEYYLAQAKWIMGGQIWADFYKTASADFARIQDPDGHWESSDALRYGTTYATAIALIVLQLPYDRLPVYQR